MHKVYIGIKTIFAQAMTRQEYNDYRGWTLPADEDGADQGYLVEYIDGGQSNHANHEGYISWSPADVFDRAYQENGKLSFAQALSAALEKDGNIIRRSGWNGADLSVYYVTPVSGIERHMVIRNGKTGVYNTWVPSSADLIAQDWSVEFALVSPP